MKTTTRKPKGFTVVMTEAQYIMLKPLSEADGWRGNMSAWARWRLGIEGPRETVVCGTPAGIDPETAQPLPEELPERKRRQVKYGAEALQ